MGKYTGVIFDLDGVICFTDKYHYQAWKAVADKLGIYFDEKQPSARRFADGQPGDHSGAL